MRLPGDWDEGRFGDISSMPERDTDPRDDTTGWERAPFACGCGRGCVSWPDHHARCEAQARLVDLEDVADEFEARREREEW